MGGLIWIIAQSVSTTPGGMIAIWATLGVPILIVTGVLVNFLFVGLSGMRLHAEEREYWSLFNARCVMLAALWMALFGLAVFSPTILMTALADDWGWLTTLLGSGWVASLATFLWAAQSEKTGTDSAFGIREALARIAPFAFLLTLFALVVTFGVWLAYDVYAHWLVWTGEALREKVRDFLSSTPQQFLNDLDERKSGQPSALFQFMSLIFYLLAIGVSWVLANLLGRAVGVNRFSLHELYKNRLVRCYLGATNTIRTPNRDTDFDFEDDEPMSSLLPSIEAAPNDSQAGRPPSHWGPIPIINFALNQRSTLSSNDSSSTGTTRESLAFVERKARPFFCTPQYSGSEATAWCRTKSFAEDITVDTAIAISGAAVSSNMGYHSSPLTTMLLTIFNMRLGAWLGNPGRDKVRRIANPPASFQLMLSELFGRTGSDADFIYLSDGGHFENTGVYELIRRRCRFIVVVDSGSDPQIHENIGRVVRMARIDFGVNININMGPVTPDAEGRTTSHVTVGRIHYGHRHAPDNHAAAQDYADPSFSYENNQGIIIWLKNAMTGDEAADLKNFQAMNGQFPFDRTSNQFFNESRFESYRKLGFHSVFSMLESITFRKSASDSTSGWHRTKFSTEFSRQAGDHSLDPCPNRGNDASPELFFDRYPVRGIFEDIFAYLLAKPKQFGLEYIRQNEKYIATLDKLRSNPQLSKLATELYGTAQQQKEAIDSTSDSNEQLAERLMVGEMLTLLENVWFALDLERHRLHPVHAGWMQVFHHWINSPRVWRHWQDQTCETSREAIGGLSTTSQQDGMKHEFSPVFREFVNDIHHRELPARTFG